MSFSVRFYTVERPNMNGLSLKQAFEAIDAVENHEERERQIAQGYRVRLERFAIDAEELAGEFIRVRTTDFPFEVKPDGVDRLQTDGPIGNGVAFRYRPNDHTLAMQYDTRIVSPGRATDYLQQYDVRAAFRFIPKMDAENWQKFRDGPVRKLQIGIASPDHLAEIEDEGASVADAFRDFGQAYGAPVLTLEMGMGHRGGHLKDAVKSLASIFHGMKDDGADLRSLRAKVVTQDGVPAEDINLLDEVLSDKFDLDLPANDPDAHYRTRRDFLKERLQAHGNGEQ